MSDLNPVRTCIGCGQTDDHPRHVIYLRTGEDVTWHIDCHALATGCATCTTQTKTAKGATGDKLRAHLTKGSST